MKRVRAKSASKKQEKESLKAALAAEGVARLSVVDINKYIEKLKAEKLELVVDNKKSEERLLLTLRKQAFVDEQLIPMRVEYTELYSAMSQVPKETKLMTGRHEARKRDFDMEVGKLVAKQMRREASFDVKVAGHKKQLANYRIGRDKNHNELAEARKVLAAIERDIISKKRVQEKLGAVLVDASNEVEAMKKNAFDARKRMMVYAKTENVLIDRVDDLKRSEQAQLKAERSAYAGMKKAKDELDTVNRLTLVKGNVIRLLDKRESELRKYYERAGLTFKK